MALNLPVDLLGHAVEVPGGPVEGLAADADAERLDADIIYVVSLIEDDNTLPLHLPGDDHGDLGVEQVLVAVHDHIGISDHLPGQEVGAPPFLAAEGAEVAEGVDAGGEEDGVGAGGGGAVVCLEEGTGGDGAGWAFGSGGADPAGGEAAAGGVDGVAGGGRKRVGIDAEVLARREAKGKGSMGGRKVGVEEAELGESFLHLVDGAGAVEELEGRGGAGDGVGGDKGEKGDGLAGPRRHLEEAVAAGVQGALQLHHVLVLLWVDVVVRKVHRHVLDLELHLRRRRRRPQSPLACFFFWSSPFA